VSASGGLEGCRVAVTRPDDHAAGLAALLREAGAVPVLMPLIAIEAARDAAPLRAAVASLQSYDWIVFTSSTAVRCLSAALQAVAGAAADPPARAAVTPRARIAAVGPATAQAVEDVFGWTVDAVPPQQVGGAVVEAMLACAPVAGRRVLWPRAEAARDALPRDLRRAGALVDDPVAYHTVPRADAARELARMLDYAELDAVILTSPSAVACLASARPRIGRAVICAIGPATAAAARAHGLPVHVEPRAHTIPALVESLRQHLQREQPADGR
jgi:uroporphyrinogen-III synthase